ncbi:MAG: Sir2 family NAD-dependent protein deacetylase, partial [Geminicoccaceae bacterium]
MTVLTKRFEEYYLRDLSAKGSIVVLTGAGISVESGLPSFRGADGLWQGHRLEE